MQPFLGNCFIADSLLFGLLLPSHFSPPWWSLICADLICLGSRTLAQAEERMKKGQTHKGMNNKTEIRWYSTTIANTTIWNFIVCYLKKYMLKGYLFSEGISVVTYSGYNILEEEATVTSLCTQRSVIHKQAYLDSRENLSFLLSQDQMRYCFDNPPDNWAFPECTQMTMHIPSGLHWLGASSTTLSNRTVASVISICHEEKPLW